MVRSSHPVQMCQHAQSKCPNVRFKVTGVWSVVGAGEPPCPELETAQFEIRVYVQQVRALTAGKDSSRGRSILESR